MSGFNILQSTIAPVVKEKWYKNFGNWITILGLVLTIIFGIVALIKK